MAERYLATTEQNPVTTADASQAPAAKLTLPTMMMMVVGSMVGAGVFSLPARFAQETGVAGALIAWVIAGTGMLMLAFVFQSLAIRKPELDAGVYAYAKAGFGEYPGFFSAFGYWASACVGNVVYWVLIMSTIGAIASPLGDGDTVLAIALSSVGLWTFYFLIRRGIKEAATINRIVTVAKVIPILVFVVLALFYLDPSVLADNFGGTGDAGSLFDQVRGTMLVTVFVFLGVEGASVYSRHAERREDVGRATILGFLGVFSTLGPLSDDVLKPDDHLEIDVVFGPHHRDGPRPVSDDAVDGHLAPLLQSFDRSARLRAEDAVDLAGARAPLAGGPVGQGLL